MIPTPDLSHLKRQDYDHVYEPAEDTFVLLDALEQDSEVLKHIKPTLCIEVGSGSGCVSAFMGRILGPLNTFFLCTDINEYANVATMRTGNQNSVLLHPVRTSLVQSLQERLSHKVDVLIFNPPYVPTDELEAISAQETQDISGAWAGGTDGMYLTNILLKQVDELLSAKGRFYLVAIAQNNVQSVLSRVREASRNLEGTIILSRRAGREHLHVLRFTRTAAPTYIATCGETAVVGQ